MNYTRKRALLACDFCRHRKRRCDGERPCSTCRESNADCRYKDLPIERVESPSASNEAVVERLGRIEALLEEQSQQLQNLCIRGPSSSSFDGSHLSISPKVSIDATAVGTDPSETADTHLFSTNSHHPFSRSSFHLTPEFAAAAISSLGSITASGTSGSATTSPPAPIASSIGVSPLLGIDASHRPQYLYQQHQHHPQQPQTQQPQSYFQQHASIPFHGANTGSNNTASHTPVFGYSSGASSFPSGSGLSTTATNTTANASHALLTSKPPSVTTSDVSSHNVEQDQQFLIPYEHSTAANTLLSLPLVRFFLQYQKRSKFGGLERRPSGGSNSEKGQSPAYFYPQKYFFDVEAHQPLPPQLDLVFSPGVVPAILPQAVLAASHPTVLDGLARNYFTYVHPSAPLFSCTQFRQWSFKVYEQGPDDSIGTAICLVVWALGSLAAPSSSGNTIPAPSSTTSSSSSPDPVAQRHNQNERDRFALSLFEPAMKIILRHTLWEFGPASLDTSQALLLAASYFSHTGRPLHNARFVYLAGRQLMRLIEEHRRDGFEPDGQILPVFWVSFIWECDRSAELDVPRSGIEPLAENMPLPSSLDPDDGDDMICFVAEIAARRLLNRIHSSLYAKGGSDSVQENLAIPDSDSATSGRTTPGNKRKRAEYDIYAPTTASKTGSSIGLGMNSTDNTDIVKMLPVSAELNRQLETWYQAMPEHIRPPLDDNSGKYSTSGNLPSFIDDLNDLDDLGDDDAPWLGNHQRHSTKPLKERVQILRIHYYAARHIIHRPFVLGVAWQHQQQILARERSNSGPKTTSNTPPPAASSSSIPPLPPAVLEKCVICVDSCVSYLIHVLPLLERRSPYLWSFCQSSMACLLVLVVADACPSIAASRGIEGHGQKRVQSSIIDIDIGRLRDQVASRLRRWAVPLSSFEAELRILESLPIASSQSGDTLWPFPKAGG